MTLLISLFLLVTLSFTVLQTQQRQSIMQHAQSATCGVPGDQGNAMGVGKYCTQGGGQCLGTSSPICSADIQLNGHGICSKSCNTDADCGTGATCYQDALGKGCKPDVCTTEQPTATPKPTAQPQPTIKLQPTTTPKPTAKPTSKPTPTPTYKPIPTVYPTQTPVPTAKPNSSVLIFKIFLHGIGNSGDNRTQLSTLSNKSPLHTKRTFTISVVGTQNLPLITQNKEFSYDPAKGAFTGTADLGNILVTGNYTVTIKTSSFITATLDSVPVIIGQQTIVDPASLIAGDVNNDDAVNTLDYNKIIQCISLLRQNKSCNAEQIQASDLNDDGKVDQTDYNLFLREINNPNL